MSQEKKAAIYDLGYQRYSGSRRPQRTRYQVIVRNLLRMSWKGWFRYKLPLGGTLAIVVGVGAAIYFSRNEALADLQLGSNIRTVADSYIPKSFTYFSQASIVVCLTILAGAISKDLKAGAFEFYFSRPVRPVDYVLGKSLGAMLLLAPILLLGPLLLTIYRVAISGDMEQMTSTLPWVPKALLVGVVATLAKANLALAFGAMSKNPRYAVAGYGAFILIFGGIIHAISINANMPSLAALNIMSAIGGFAAGVFDVSYLFGRAPPDLLPSALALAGYTVASFGFIWYRVAIAERSGMGGS